MKTLIINGSPRKKGDTAALISEMLTYLKGEVIYVNTYYDDISPCLDCRYCWKHERCAINDEMQNIYKLLDEVDNVIMASPLYMSELTGKLLSFASRFQLFYALKYIHKNPNFKLKKKNGILIITGGGNGGPDPALKTADTIFKQINVKLVDSILSLDTDELPTKKDTEALNKAKQAAQKLNMLYG